MNAIGKTCTTCKQTKRLIDFYPSTQSADGLLGLCKTCVAQYMRQYRQKHPDKFRRSATQWQAKHPKQYDAQIRAKIAKRAGKLTSPGACQICNAPSALDMHHCDYNKPLEVHWLCRRCHGRVHLVVQELACLASA